MFSGIPMYCAAGLTKATYWLLAAALAVQPVMGTVCDCDTSGREEGTQCRMEPGCCKAARGGYAERVPQPTCCPSGADAQAPQPSVCACHCCGTRVPAAPPAPGAERGPSTDLAAPACGVPAAMIDAHASDGFGRFFRQSTFFASASDHCVALCRWQL